MFVAGKKEKEKRKKSLFDLGQWLRSQRAGLDTRRETIQAVQADREEQKEGIGFKTLLV